MVQIVHQILIVAHYHVADLLTIQQLGKRKTIQFVDLFKLLHLIPQTNHGLQDHYYIAVNGKVQFNCKYYQKSWQLF